MGGRSWWYLTEYEKNPGHALQALRERVFEAGDFLFDGQVPETIEEVLDAAGEEGTSSILDVEAVAKGGGIGVAVPATATLLKTVFGTAAPTEADCERAAVRVADRLARWRCVYFPVYRGKSPVKWCFAGASGDGAGLEVGKRRAAPSTPADPWDGDPPPPADESPALMHWIFERMRRERAGGR